MANEIIPYTGGGGGGGGSNVPAIFNSLINSVIDLSDSIDKHERTFKQYTRKFLEYQRAFNKHVKALPGGGGSPKLLPYSGGGGTGGGGGGGKGGGGDTTLPNPGGRGKNLALLGIGYQALQFALNKVTQALMDASEVQQRALASNTTISKLNIFSSNQLGINLKTLAMELLSLKEEGVNNLNQSTLNLIGRMKLTGQSTEALIKMLGSNSVFLNLNNKQAQNLVSTLADFSLNYGVRQDRLLDFASAMSKQLELPSLLGFGKNLTESISLLAAKTGGKGEEAVQKAVQFITNPENYSKLVALGINQYADKWLTANAQEGALLMQQMAETASKTIQSRVGNIGGPASLTRATAAMSPFGQEAGVFMQLTTALKDSNQLVSENQNNLKTLATLGEQLLIPIQYLGGILAETITFLGPVAEIIVRSAGIILAVVGVLSAYKGISSLIMAIPKFLPLLANPFGWVPLLVGALVIGIGSYLFDALSDNTKEIKKLNDQKDDDNLKKPISNFMLQIGENIRQLGMTKSGHDEQVKEYLRSIALHTGTTAQGFDGNRGMPTQSQILANLK